MERLLADATKLTGVKYDINNLADVYNAIHAVQGELGITGTTALEAEQTLQGSMAAMKGSFENFLGALSLGKETAGQDLANLVLSVVTFAKNVGRMVFNILMTLPKALIEAIPILFNTLVTSVQTNGPRLWNEFTTLLTTTLNKIQENLPQWLEKGRQFVSNLLNGVQEYAPKILSGVLDLLIKMIGKIQENLPKWLEKGKQLLTRLLDGIHQYLPTLISGLLNVLTKMISTIVSKGPEFLTKGVLLLTKLAAGIWSYMPTLVSKVIQILAKVVSTILSYVPELLALGVQLIKNLATGIWNNRGQVTNNLRNIGSSMLSTLRSALSGIFNIGVNLVKGLWNGIGSVKDWILGKIKGFGSSIVSGIKSFFGIHSPSRVFRDEVGSMLGQGLALGIEDEVSTVSRAMDELQNATVRDLNSVMGIDTYSNASINSGFVGSTLHANLSLGERAYKLLVEDFTNEQDRQTELGLAY